MPEKPSEEMWEGVLTGRNRIYMGWGALRRILGALPATDRCKNCNAPFTGPASLFMRVIGKGRYNRNPRFCSS